jgi:hypothetical protein
MLSAFAYFNFILVLFQGLKIFLSTKLIGIQERQCTYSLILRRVLATNVTVENKKAFRILGVCLEP